MADVYVKETQCTHCVHREVCSKRDDFLKAQKAVDDLYVPLDGSRGINLRDLKWIKPVTLQCGHYMNATLTR